MKTAISLPDDLFAVVDKYANDSGLSRSAVIAEALREFIVKHKAVDITARINDAVSLVGQPRDPAVIAQSTSILRKTEW